MIRHLILKAIAVLTLVIASIVALAFIVVIGYFFLALAFPNRMTVKGRVIDSAGKPIKSVEVRAIPLPIHVHFSEASMEPQDKEHKVFTDENGRYRFKRLIASGGVKEGMWVQQYDIIVNAEGYIHQKIRVRNDFKSHKDVITLTDFVLEKELPDNKADSKLLTLLGKE